MDAPLELVGGQTGQEMDDVGAVTSSRGYVFIQAKHRLSISSADDSPFAAAVGQAVRQYLAGAPSDPDGARRPLEPGRDALVICTDTVTTANRLATVITRLADLPTELPLLQVARSQPERSMLKALFKHLRSAYRAHERRRPSQQQLRDIIRLLRVVSLQLDPEGSDRVTAETHLQGVLADRSNASGAWHSLETFGQELNEGQRWAARQEVTRALIAGGHPVGVDPSYRDDVQRLRDITRALVGPNAAELTIPAPEGTVCINRDISGLVRDTDGSFALVGDPGAGKSVLATMLATGLLDAGEDVVFLRAENLASSLGMTRAELNMRNNLDDVLHGWSGHRRATLIVDGVDATRGSGTVDWLPQLARSLRDTRWRVIATIRTYDLRHGPRWKEMFPGQPVDSGHADPSVAGARHVLVSHFTDGELQQVKRQSPSLDALLSSSNPSLLGLLRNPFNLRLASTLIHDEGNRAALAAVRTRQGLLHLYWDHRVEEVPDGAAVIQKLCEAMVANRRARIDEPHALLAMGERTALAALLHAGVVVEDAQTRRLAVHPVRFSHPVLYDFAVAHMCLGGPDPLHLKLRLDRDPDLAITIRPSLDLHLADLWSDHDSRGPFWDLAIALSRPGDGHAIAAVAAACAALRESPTESDLMPLERRALVADDLTQAARRCIIHLAGALDASSLTAFERATSAPALSHLAARLAERAVATGDFGLADLARVVLHRLSNRFPLGEGSLEVAVRGRAVADVMRFALADHSGTGRERLALLVGDAVARAAVLLPDELGPVIDAMIDPSVMAVWGGRVVDRLSTQLGSIARVAPDLALRLARSVWDFEEPREQTTILMESNIRSFTSNRQQDLDMARYNTGEQFHSMLSAAPEAALGLFLSLLDSHAGAAELSRPSDQPPRVYLSHDLTAVGFGALSTMEHALIDFITLAVASDNAATQSQADNMIDSIARQLTHHQVWRDLLGAGTSHPASLGKRLLPLLRDGDLLGHHLVRSTAQGLVAALSPVLTAEEHLELEAAVLTARDPLDLDVEHRRRLIDALLSRLDRSCVQGAATENRLAELDRRGGSQSVDGPVPTPFPGAFFPSGLRMMAGAGNPTSGADTAISDAMERLRTDLAQSRSMASQHLDVRESVPALHALITQGASAIEQSVSEEAFTLLLDGADLLASDADVLPATPLGDLVVGLLTEAVPEAPSLGRGTMIARGASATYSAVFGLTRLLEHEEWRRHPEGERIRQLLLPLLDSPDETVRMLAATALPHLASDDGFWRELSMRLSREQSGQVIDVLLLAAARRGSEEPRGLDDCLHTIASGPAATRLLGVDEDTSKPLNERKSAIGDLLLQILLYLGLQHVTPFASGVLGTWMQEPLRHPVTLDRLITWTRTYLNPQARTNVAAQERAFHLLTNLAGASVGVIRSAEETLSRGGTLTSDDRLDLESAGRIADCIARDLFHASGAFRPPGQTAQTDERAASRGFCDLAFPIIESLARVPSAATAHHLVQVLTFLGQLEPRRAFLAVADIVTTNEAYRYEPMGETAVLDIVDTYLAERRDLVLGDPTCLTALRRILEAFVDIDSDRAIQRVQELSEIFV